MSASCSDLMSALDALSPVDGRYQAAAAPLRALLSERALVLERIRIEAQWVSQLAAAVPQLPGAHLSPAVLECARQLASAPEPAAAEAVKSIEARINHDVKAVECYVREQLSGAGAGVATLELVHFGGTSENISNLGYARLLQAARAALLGTLDARGVELTELAHRYADMPMPARTHGQAASPTTLGKELANFAARLRRAQRRWSAVSILGKWNGAVGNFNAHVLALPAVDWPAVSRAFVSSMALEYNPWTTQIEPHDWIGEYCVALAHALIAWSALGRGLAKIEADRKRMAADLDAAWEVLAEAVQTVLRAAGVPGGYERLRELTRGRAIDAAAFAAFVETLPLAQSEKARLKALRPADYVGLAAQLARQV